MRAPSVLVLAPGFPVEERPFYAPAVVDLLAAVAPRLPLEICAIRPPPARPGVHHFRGLPVLALGGAGRGRRVRELFARAHAGRRVDVVWGLWADRTGLLGLALARSLGARLLLSLMGGELAERPELGYAALARRPRGALLRAALLAADRVTAGSRSLLARLGRFSPAAALKAELLPLGVPLERLSPRAGAPWSKGQVLRVLVVADLRPVKRLDLLGQVERALAVRGIEARFTVYGAGAPPAGPRLEHRGFVAPAELMAAYAEHDVLLHPSEFESQGMCLVEAALSGLPVAALEVGVARELAELGAAVSVAPAPRAEALADAALAAAGARPREGAAPLLRARYGLEAAARRAEHLLIALAAPRAGGAE